MLRSTVLLFSALCLDFAYESSVHAFLPVPGVLRASLGRQNIPALSLHTSQVGRLPSASRIRSGPCAILRTKAIFGGDEQDIELDDVQTVFPTADRVVAIGDVHGDFDALSGCLKIAKLVDDESNWIGGTCHLVQLGDILDRGDSERSCIDLLFKLRKQAEEAGGKVHVLLGNHEVMNVDLDFRYVTHNAWEGWGEPEKTGSMRLDLRASLSVVGFPAYMKQRVQAFRPGGSEAKRLAKMPVAIVIGDTLLVHGGLRAKHIKYGVERMNSEMAAWLEGPPKFKVEKPDIIDDADSPIWARLYSVPTPKMMAERELEEVLKTMKARRMVVGHTPQLRGINAFVTENGFEVWRTDTGMSSGMMSGPLECLEVLADGTVHVLTTEGTVPAALRMPEVEGDFMDVCEIDTGICTEAPADSAELLKDDSAAPADGQSTLQVKAPSEVPIGSLSPENSKEVEKLRDMDDVSKSISARLTVLVEQLIVDAIQRQDEGLTKKTVKDMLRKVVGTRIVDDNTNYISAEVDRIISSDVADLVAKYMSADEDKNKKDEASAKAASEDKAPASK